MKVIAAMRVSPTPPPTAPPMIAARFKCFFLDVPDGLDDPVTVGRPVSMGKLAVGAGVNVKLCPPTVTIGVQPVSDDSDGFDGIGRPLESLDIPDPPELTVDALLLAEDGKLVGPAATESDWSAAQS